MVHTWIGYNIYMSFLENLENSIRMDGSDDVNDSLALKLFKDQCCDSCSCRTESDHK